MEPRFSGACEFCHFLPFSLPLRIREDSHSNNSFALTLTQTVPAHSLSNGGGGGCASSNPPSPPNNNSSSSITTRKVVRLSFREDKEEKEEEDRESKKSSNSPSRKVEIVEVKEEVRNNACCLLPRTVREWLLEIVVFTIPYTATKYARALITEGKSTVLLIAWGVVIIGPD